MTVPNKTKLAEEYLRIKRALFDKKFSFLNAQQREAVFSINGALLVLAGAGTGKTTLLVNRIAYILRYGNAYLSENVPFELTEKTVDELKEALDTFSDDTDMLLDSFAEDKCPPWGVLSITFTNKAANEMKARIQKLIGEETASDIWCGTFHSMCLRMLRANADKIGFDRDFTIYDTDESKKVISECMSQLKFDEKNLTAKAVQNSISRAKDKLITPEEYDAQVGGDFKLQNISSVYTMYQNKLTESMAVDFDDIIMKTVLMFREHPDVLEHYRRKFRYILVDEFQDTNRAQFELVSMLSGDTGNIMVVGDDDQSIYKFRGATIENILHFDDKIKDTKIIKLEENYRSCSNILDAANSVIRHNFGRRGKELWSTRGEGELVSVKRLPTQNDEAKFIVNKITELVVREKRRFADFAVLFRMNAQSGNIENAFARSGVPYRLLGGVRYYERKEVRDILAYLCVINNPNDNLRLSRIINEPKRKIGEATLSAVELIADNESKSMFYVMENSSAYPQIAKSAGKFKPFVEMIKLLREKSNTLSLSELVEETLTATGYIEMLEKAEENGESTERRENVMELLSVTKEFENNRTDATLQNFLEEIALFTDIDNYDREADAVVLMTVHSAKGLEFPVVFIPGMEEGIFPSQLSAMSPDELEEERRLAYVAITRAKDRVFIIHTRERMLYGRTSYNMPSRFIDEIDEKYKDCEGEPEKRKFRSEFGERTKKVKISNELFSSSALSSEVGRTRNGETFTEGDRVKHLTFGEGTVLSCREMGADMLYEVAFDDCGTKKLMATYAKLKKV